MTNANYTIGVDFGTLSARAVALELDTGIEAAEAVFEYPHGVMDVQLPCGKKLPPQFALQHPQDYLDALKAVSIPAVEVHLSDISAREPFRRLSYAGLACVKTFAGYGFEGYRMAAEYLKNYLK